MKLANDRVRVTEIVYEPGVARQSYLRPTDQLVVFLEDCRFERIDGETGERVIRERHAGDAVWHSRGEKAPVLTNIGEQPYRTLLIELL